MKKKTGKFTNVTVKNFQQIMENLAQINNQIQGHIGPMLFSTPIPPEERSQRDKWQQFEDYELRRLIARLVKERYKEDIGHKLTELPRMALIQFCQELGI